MNCLYCQQECTPNQHSSNYWYCFPCHINYELFNDSMSMISFKLPQEAKGQYALVLDLESQTTELLYLSNLEDGTPDLNFETLVELDFIMPGVNPQNVHNKIKTLLVFS